MIITLKWIGIILVLSSVLSSCGGDDEPSIVSEASITIEEYIIQNNLTTQVTNSGLHYIIKDQGVAPNPSISSVITINYTGYLLNGNVFDSGNGVSFGLSGFIQGWQEGLQLIGTGGSITLLIPANLAYGTPGRDPIPPNTPLGFDIDLISFQ